jgi:alpha 1,3-glucosidase
MSLHKIPCDAIWLDIEYTNEKKYFTWNKETFPKAKEMLETLLKEGRKLITIIDPHIKKDDKYFVYKDAIEKKLFVFENNESVNPFYGNCWPKLSLWLDFMNPHCRDYLKQLYTSVHPDVEDIENYIWTDQNVHIWNDMNEPACFEKYDKSMPKECIH